jgi:arsenate reductase
MGKQINVLFLCVANSARSQLAEGLAKSIFGEKAIIESAGSEPSGVVQPWAIKSLNSIGIDISKNYSKSFDKLSPTFLNNLDYIVTLCAEEACPHINSKAKRLHWPIPDPARFPEEEKPAAFARAIEMIRKNLVEWSKQI